MPYVDGFLVPVPTKKLAAYARMSSRAGKIWREHGALQYIEAAGDDLKHGNVVTDFRKGLAMKAGETLVFAWILYKSRAHRDRVNAKVMQDPRMAKMMAEPPIMNMKRMRYGGFKAIVVK